MPADYDEVYFCAQCSQQYAPESKNEKCPVCKKRTVSWRTQRQTLEQAVHVWEQINGKVKR